MKSTKGYTALSFSEAEELVDMLESGDYSIASAWQQILNNKKRVAD